MSYDELDKAANEGKGLNEPQLEDVTSPAGNDVTSPAGNDVTPPAGNDVTSPAEPVDNAERSQLGRKVKELTETVASLQQVIVEGIKGNSSVPASIPSSSSGSENEFTVPTTWDEFKTAMNKIKEDEEKASSVYSNSYLEKVATLGVNESMHKEIVDEMMTNFNIRRSDSGPNDAMINYYQAKASVLSKKMAQPIEKRNPFEGVPPAAPTGVGGGGIPPASPVSPPTLDPDSERYVNYLMRTTGKSKEDIVKNLADVLK